MKASKSSLKSRQVSILFFSAGTLFNATSTMGACLGSPAPVMAQRQAMPQQQQMAMAQQQQMAMAPQQTQQGWTHQTAQQFWAGYSAGGPSLQPALVLLYNAFAGPGVIGPCISQPQQLYMLLQAIGQAPENAQGDLLETFHEMDRNGSGAIEMDDFLAEMFERRNNDGPGEPPPILQQQQMYGQPIGQPTYGQVQPMAYAQPMPVATMAMPQAVPVQGMRRA